MVIKSANLLLRLLLGGVLIFAGALKVFAPAEFAGQIVNYRLLPHEFVNMVAITLPWAELATGLFLVMGVWVRAAALLAAGMAGVFVISVGQAVARGLNIECGCFGTAAGTRVGLIHLAGVLAMFIAAAWLVWKHRVPSPLPPPAPRC